MAAAKTDTSMTIRMNKKVKQEAQEIFSALGMDMTTAINVFLRQAIYFKGFPFDVRLDVLSVEPSDEAVSDPFYSESNMKHLQKSIKQLEEGQVVVKTMDELEAGAAFNSMRAKAAAKGYMTDAEIEAEIAAARSDGS